MRTTWARPPSDSPRAKTFHDFRRMFDELHEADRRGGREHARPHPRRGRQAGAGAGQARLLREAAHATRSTRRACWPRRPPRHKVATQMGNAGHSSEGDAPGGRADPGRRHRPGPRGPRLDQPADLAAGHRPARGPPPVPQSLHWDLWLGPAPERPYNPAYHPFKWRGWWDFGTGALGDMGCHIIDAAFWALELRDPTTVEAESPPVRHPETAPAWSIVRYEFPAQRRAGPPVKLVWYDGGKLPPPSCSTATCPPRAPAAASSWARRAGCWSAARAGTAATGSLPRARLRRLRRTQAHAAPLARPPRRVDRGLQDRQARPARASTTPAR